MFSVVVASCFSCPGYPFYVLFEWNNDSGAVDLCFHSLGQRDRMCVIIPLCCPCPFSVFQDVDETAGQTASVIIIHREVHSVGNKSYSGRGG